MSLVLLSDRHAYRTDMLLLDALGYQPEPFRKWVEGLVEDRVIELRAADEQQRREYYANYWNANDWNRGH